jgi:hypothetical protein
MTELNNILDHFSTPPKELRPCPFCGFEAVTTNYNPDVVACTNPGCPNEIHDEVGLPKITIDEWNTRPLEDALRKQLDVAVAGIQIAKIILEHRELHWATRIDDATNKLQITLAEIQKIGGKE